MCDCKKEELINKLTDRFLRYRFPKDISPDGGLSFTPPSHPNHPYPTGTNLLDADQAREMFKKLLGGYDLK